MSGRRGRSPAVLDHDALQAVAGEGLSQREAAARLGVSAPTFRRVLKSDARAAGIWTGRTARLDDWRSGPRKTIPLPAAALTASSMAGTTMQVVAASLGMSRPTFVKRLHERTDLHDAWHSGIAARRMARAPKRERASNLIVEIDPGDLRRAVAAGLFRWQVAQNYSVSADVLRRRILRDPALTFAWEAGRRDAGQRIASYCQPARAGYVRAA